MQASFSTKHSIGPTGEPKNGVGLADGIYWDSTWPKAKRMALVNSQKLQWISPNYIDWWNVNINDYKSDNLDGDKRFAQFAVGTVITFVQE